MKTQSIDTHLKTEKLLISLLKQKSAAEKLSQIRSLSRTTIQLSRRAISRAKKTIDKNQIDLFFIEYHYGKDLAERIKKYLNIDNHEKS